MAASIPKPLNWRSRRAPTFWWRDRPYLESEEWPPKWRVCGQAWVRPSTTFDKKGITMQLGMIGLGRMGANMVRRLVRGGHECVVFDMSPKVVDELVQEKAVGAVDL